MHTSSNTRHASYPAFRNNRYSTVVKLGIILITTHRVHEIAIIDEERDYYADHSTCHSRTQNNGRNCRLGRSEPLVAIGAIEKRVAQWRGWFIPIGRAIRTESGAALEVYETIILLYIDDTVSCVCLLNSTTGSIWTTMSLVSVRVGYRRCPRTVVVNVNTSLMDEGAWWRRHARRLDGD